jgi:hypothetical protein
MTCHEWISAPQKGVSQKFLTVSHSPNAVPFVNQHDQEQTFVIPFGTNALPRGFCRVRIAAPWPLPVKNF